MPCNKCGAVHACDDMEIDRLLDIFEDGSSTLEEADRLAVHLYRCEMHMVVFEMILAGRGFAAVKDANGVAQLVPHAFGGSVHRA